MSLQNSSPEKTFIGIVQLDYLPDGGTEGTDNIIQPFKRCSFDTETETAQHLGLVNGIKVIDRSPLTSVKTSFTLTTDEVLRDELFNITLGGTHDSITPGQNRGKIKIELYDLDDTETPVKTIAGNGILLPDSGGDLNSEDYAESSFKVILFRDGDETLS